jgi:hypothetical protein
MARSAFVEGATAPGGQVGPRRSEEPPPAADLDGHVKTGVRVFLAAYAPQVR